MKQETSIEDIFHDFMSLRTFKVGIKVKKKLLKELLEACQDPWKVVGITPNALDLLKKNGFNLKNKNTNKNLSIQRAHLEDRDIWYSELLETDWKDSQSWHQFVRSKDNTVLALSSENKNIKSIVYIKFENFENLFRSTRISWQHGPKEKEFLKSLDRLNHC